MDAAADGAGELLPAPAAASDSCWPFVLAVLLLKRVGCFLMVGGLTFGRPFWGGGGVRLREIRFVKYTWLREVVEGESRKVNDERGI